MKNLRPFYLAVLCLFISGLSYGQISIYTDNTPPHSSTALDIKITDKGLLIPRVKLTGTNDLTTITTPANGLLVYNLQNAGTGDNEVLANNVYYFNRSINKWSLFINKDIIQDQLNDVKVPTLANFTYKNTGQSGLNTGSHGDLSVIDFTNNVSLFRENITFNGSTEFTINKTGYYNFSGFVNWKFNPSSPAYWWTGIQVKQNSATSWPTGNDISKLNLTMGMRCIYVKDTQNHAQPCNFNGTTKLLAGNVFRFVAVQSTVGAIPTSGSLEVDATNGIPYSAGFTTLFFPE
ncbi:MAG: hypothetical protein ACK5MD_10615 [Flavobacteriales bacterium]